MSSPAEFAIRRPITIIMMFVSLMAVGVIASRLLPLEYFPELDAPFILVQIPYAGSTPDEVEREIARPVEEVLATISGVERLESTSSPQQAQFVVEFDWGVDIAIKAMEARERVEAIRNQLPSDIRRINVFKFNTADAPVLTLRISSERDLSNSYDMIRRILIRPLERLPGVARVELQGLEPKEIRIELIADRVTAHNIDLNQLQRQLQAINFSASAGLISEGDLRYRVTPRGEFDRIEQYSNLVINDDGLRLSDIAEIRYTSAERNYARHLDRAYAIGVSVFKENGANLVDVGRRVLTEVERIGAQPEMNGINLFFLENQSEGVVDSLTELRNAGLLGAVLALLVLYFFLRNLPMTMMVALAVPIAITITLGFMYFIGISLNILSMMGLMLAIGMLVDNAVVVSESIFTEREKTPGQTIPATVRGVRAVGLAVAAGTLTSAAVFLPNIFGEQNQVSIFMQHVAVAIVVSLGISLVIAQTVIPLIASRLQPPKAQQSSPLLEGLRRRYVSILRWTLIHRWKSGLLIVLTFLSVLVPAMVVETDMFPASQTRQLFLRYNLDSQYTLPKIKQSVDRIEEYLYANQERFEIRAVYSYYDETGEAQSTILLTDDDQAERASTEIAQEITEGLPKIAIGQPSFDQNRSGSGEGVSVTIIGDSSDTLKQLGSDVVRLLNSLPGLSSARLPINPNEQELQVRVDRERARLLGFSTSDVANAVAIALRGIDLREYKGQEGEVPVKLQFREADKSDPNALNDIKLTNASGERIPLPALVDIVTRPGANEIRRVNRETSISVQANLDDITMERARELIETNMELMELPPGYEWRLGRGFSREDNTGQKMLLNILLAMVIIYIVLAALFESLLYPATMIVSILFSIVGVYWFFMFTGTIFSLMAMIGILILIGVVVNNGIVLIDHINQLRNQGMERNDAVLQAGRDRLRPILMTVGTTVLGLLPLCFGTTQIGGDGPPYFPMARAIVGGLLFSTVVSLVFLPTIYNWLDYLRRVPGRLFRWAGERFARLLPRRRRRQAATGS
ncbi:MAG: efflux RND transporter permease subunit [Wenzhouxiangellaceae bacterium]